MAAFDSGFSNPITTTMAAFLYMAAFLWGWPQPGTRASVSRVPRCAG
jgi:hypothetical protein